MNCYATYVMCQRLLGWLHQTKFDRFNQECDLVISIITIIQKVVVCNLIYNCLVNI